MPPEGSGTGFQASAAGAFLAYTAGVFVLAYLSHRVLQKRSFLSEYYLGSRGLGVWALAMTYAATAASGGSFMGFPAKIYQHGWILALWIASYMIVPVCTMGILGKRINQVARKTGAITVPDIFRDRFRNPRLGVAASLLMVFFLTFNLVAQFKAGASIIETLIGDLPGYGAAAEWIAWIPETFSVLSATRPTPGYCLALFIFAGAVITYTVYGGFRAVVWTDVLQGVVMFVGVLLLLGFTLARVEGGLEGATRRRVLEQPAAVTLEAREAVRLDAGAVVTVSGEGRVWRLTSSNPIVMPAGETRSVTFFSENGELPPGGFPAGARTELVSPDDPRVRAVSARFDPRRNYFSGPGFSPARPGGFLPLALAFSYFIMWAISGAGQPTTMVRLMAFRDTPTYRRAMFSVSIYYSLIYIPLIIIFVCAPSLVGELEDPDQAMPRLVLTVAPGILAGLILAAPFAAVMSTVDSFLLAISSSIVRDIYQRGWNPEASQKTLRRLSYIMTPVIGVIVMLGAVNPPRFLQDIIVLVGAGFACTFLAPMFFSLYWKRMTAAGVYAGMIGGFGVCLALYGLGWLGLTGTAGTLEQYPGGLLPLVWGLAASILLSIAGSLVSPSPAPEIVDFYFKADPAVSPGPERGSSR